MNGYLTAALVGEVLPFRDPADSQVPPPRIPLEPSPEAGETAAFIPALTAEDALPFGGSWVDTSGSDMNETAPVGALAPEDVLPFSGEVASTPASARHELGDQEMSGATAMIDPGVIREISDVLPFGATQRQPDFASWAIENYASLCAECAVRPRERPQIHARYHIADDAERAALDAYWQEKMANDRALARRFRELMVQAGDWVR